MCFKGPFFLIVATVEQSKQQISSICKSNTSPDHLDLYMTSFVVRCDTASHILYFEEKVGTLAHSSHSCFPRNLLLPARERKWMHLLTDDWRPPNPLIRNRLIISRKKGLKKQVFHVFNLLHVDLLIIISELNINSNRDFY